jgi:hypothetical protein
VQGMALDKTAAARLKRELPAATLSQHTPSPADAGTDAADVAEPDERRTRVLGIPVATEGGDRSYVAVRQPATMRVTRSMTVTRRSHPSPCAGR